MKKEFFIGGLVLFSFSLNSQVAYQVNNKVKDFAVTNTINSSGPVKSLGDLTAELTILDFFGTWCIPCLEALPHLALLQEKFRGKVNIVLLSNEQLPRLEKFVRNRQPFPFPVIVDETNAITDLFAPPSYPYTVVLNKEKTIIAITDAGSLTENSIAEWMAGKAAVVNPAPLSNLSPVTTVNLVSSNKLVQLSQEFMYAAKTGDSTVPFVQSLSELTYDRLRTQLRSDEEKKAFWINLYNGFTQVLIKKNPANYKNRGRFFTSKQISIAGKSFSLDDIEHGILRRSKIKWSLGHLNKLFPGKTEKQLRVDGLDYRLHFALNCGAKSCPPIAFYNPENLNPQLELATTAYLQSEAEYDPKTNTLKLPAIMGWFRGDFGGKKKMVQLLKEKKLLPADATPKIKFKSYDWTLYTDNYLK